MTDVKHVLILEDNLALALEWVSTFELNQCEVTLCDNVRDALDFLESETYDLLITDLFLNEQQQGGLYLLREIAKLEISAPPIIAVTGAVIPNQSETDRNIFLDSARLLGATTYIQKPFPAGELVVMAHDLWETKNS